MTNFLTTLRALHEQADGGTWYEIDGDIQTTNGHEIANGMTAKCRPNMQLAAFLRNRAAAIAGVVEAAHTLRKSGDACIASIAKWQATELKDKAIADEYLAAWKIHCEDWMTFNDALAALEEPNG